jgi:hypothetical protein
MNEQTQPQTATEALEHPFGKPGERNHYRIFPDELANDPHVYFHGTERRVLQAILEEGFRIPPLPWRHRYRFRRPATLRFRTPAANARQPRRKGS